MTFVTAISHHWGTLLTLRGVPARIERGEARCDVAKILLARADGEAITSREHRYEAARQDVIIKVSDYAPTYAGPAASAVTVPADGDRIVVDVDGYTLTLEVRPSGQSEKAARHTDSGRTQWRISTKLISRVESE